MMMRLISPVAVAGAALVAAGCGGGTSAGSSTAGATGTVAGTVATIASSTTTAEGSASFDVRFGKLRQQLQNGLEQVKNGNAADRLVGAGTVLDTCSTTVTTQLGARASTPTQQERVSRLRTACADAGQAVAKLKSGDASAAERLAGTALQELDQAS